MGNHPQLIVLLVFFGLSALSWAVNKAREHKQVQQAREAQRRRREQELRTGREEQAQPTAGGQGHSGPLPSLQELAAKRQAQLEELRARQQAKARGASVATGAAATRPAPQPRPAMRPAPPAPGVPRPPRKPTPAVTRPAPPAATPVPQTGPRGRSGRPAPPARAPKAPARRPIVIGQPPAKPAKTTPKPPQVVEPVRKPGLAESTGVSDDFGESTTRGLLGGLAPEFQPEPVGGPKTGSFTPAAMRRAIILSEILAPPVSMRENR